MLRAVGKEEVAASFARSFTQIRSSCSSAELIQPDVLATNGVAQGSANVECDLLSGACVALNEMHLLNSNLEGASAANVQSFVSSNSSLVRRIDLSLSYAP